MFPHTRRLCLRLAVFCLAFLAVAAAALADAHIAADVHQRVRAATVMVRVEYDTATEHRVSWGSGFVVGNGLVMTNAHVVRDNTPTRIFIQNDLLPATEATVLAARYDPDGRGDPRATYFDVALLSYTPAAGAQLPALPFALTPRPRDGVFAFGYPGTRQPPQSVRQTPGSRPATSLVVTGGSVNQIIRATPHLLMHDAYCENGNSGGPLVNGRGEVVGMQTWSAPPDERNVVSSFAISSAGLTAFMQGAGYPPAVASR